MPSSVISHMSYDATRQVLRIIFVSGKIYDYLNVPGEIYQRLMAASSKGSFFNLYVKGIYEFKKLKRENIKDRRKYE